MQTINGVNFWGLSLFIKGLTDYQEYLKSLVKWHSTSLHSSYLNHSLCGILVTRYPQVWTSTSSGQNSKRMIYSSDDALVYHFLMYSSFSQPHDGQWSYPRYHNLDDSSTVFRIPFHHSRLWYCGATPSKWCRKLLREGIPQVVQR